MAKTNTVWIQIKDERHIMPRQVWAMAQARLSIGWGHPTQDEIIGELTRRELWGELYRSTANDGYTVWHEC